MAGNGGGFQPYGEGVPTALGSEPPAPMNQVGIGSLGNLYYDTNNPAEGILYAKMTAGTEADATPSWGGSPFYVFYLKDAHVYSLNHATQCTAWGDTNNTRTTIGIGEKVDLGGLPDCTDWTISGEGTLSSTNGSGTTLSAKLDPGDIKITATINYVGQSVPVTVPPFMVIVPSSVAVLGYTDKPLGTEVANGDVMGAHTEYSIVICPTNVSFHNVQFRENPDPANITNTWPNGVTTVLPINRTGSFGVSCGNPFLTDTNETIPIWTSYLCVGNNCSDESIQASWTDQYKDESGAWADFFNLNVQYYYFASDFKCQITYLGVPGGKQGPYNGSQ